MIEDDQDWAAMPTLSPDFVMNSYSKATNITSTSNPNLYLVDLKRDWAIGLGKFCFWVIFLPNYPTKLTSSKSYMEVTLPLLWPKQQYITSSLNART